MKRGRKYVKKLSTRLTSDETKSFRKIKRFVIGYCGKVSDAEVLRYLVRDWVQKGNY